MIPKQPSKLSLIAHHSYHLSKHAARIIAVVLVVAGSSFVVINLALLTMQISSLPLFLKAGGTSLSLSTPGQARVVLANYSHAQVLNLKVQGQNYKTNAEAAGIKLNTSAIVAAAQKPAGWNKIPLVYALHNRTHAFPLQYTIDNSTLKNYLGTIKLPQEKTATSATIVIPDEVGKAAYVAPETDGYLFTVDQLVTQVDQQVSQNKNLRVVAVPAKLQPKVVAAELTTQLNQVNSMLGSGLSISNGAKSYKLTPADLRKIVSVTVSGTGLPQANVSNDQIIELLREHSNIFYIAPVSGQAKVIDISASASQIAKALQTGQKQQALTMSAAGADTAYLAKYPATSAGLTSLINDYASSHSGVFAVRTTDLSGDRKASYSTKSATVSASTYKIFVAWLALKRVEQGSLSMGSQTSRGTLDYCLQRAIVNSDNDCAEAILDLLGWSNAQADITTAGFSGTQLGIFGDSYSTTTARDLARILRQLYQGTLLNSSDTSYLLNLMKIQTYRDGIPAGSPGAVVADKVGFLTGYYNDAGIVYGPKNTYVLVILTTNNNFDQIKELSNQIFNLYNQ